MTRKPHTPKPARTSPPDRDGDGRPGGSLPGNQTVEAAKGADPQAEAATAAGNPNQPDAGPPNSEASPPAEPWTRNDELILLKLADAGFEIKADVDDAVTLEQIKAWADDHARAVETFADEYINGTVNDDDDRVREDGQVIDLPNELRKNVMAEPEAEPDPVAQAVQDDAAADAPADPADTFTPEEIAAGQTAGIGAEVEPVATAAEAETVIDDAEPLVAVEDNQGDPVFVRLDNLKRLVDNLWLYRFGTRYSIGNHGPWVEQDEIDVWVKAGLARYDESAGNNGGVYVEPPARKAVALMPSGPA